MTPHQFAAKWKPVTLKEMSAYAEHFNDLCGMLGEETPAEADPAGTFFTFQKGVTKAGGGKGFADAWRRGCFGWVYKGKHKDLGPPTTSSCSTARPWRTRRCWSCAT